MTLRGFTWSRRLYKSSLVLVGRRSRRLGASCLAGLQLRREMRGISSMEEGMLKGGFYSASSSKQVPLRPYTFIKIR